MGGCFARKISGIFSGSFCKHHLTPWFSLPARAVRHRLHCLAFTLLLLSFRTHVYGLQALGTFCNFELHFGILLERLVALDLDLAEVAKNALTIAWETNEPRILSRD